MRATSIIASTMLWTLTVTFTLIGGCGLAFASLVAYRVLTQPYGLVGCVVIDGPERWEINAILIGTLVGIVFGSTGIRCGLVQWRHRHITPAHCRRCGYDLTGNVSGRCPECGEAV